MSNISNAVSAFSYAERTFLVAEKMAEVLSHLQGNRVDDALRLLKRHVGEGDKLVGWIKAGEFPAPNQYFNVDELVTFSKKYQLKG